MSLNGLTNQEAKKRLKKYGKNELKKIHKINLIKIFLTQFTSPLILILIIVAVISFALGFVPGQKSNVIDVILILLIVLASGISGFFQEYKSEKTLEALQNMAIPKTKVIRNGKKTEISVKDIVVGDLVFLEAGDMVPADAELIESFNLKVDESILTGESKAVNKKAFDKIFMNTLVTYGNAKAIIIKTGMQTKVGSIATKIQEIKEEKTIFQIELSELSKKISLLILGLTIIMIIIGLFKYNFFISVLTALALAVAAIPEGLPAVVVLTLTIGSKVMSKKNALTRKLGSIESLGAVNVICTDKTGTLTKNKMTVTNLFFNNKVFDVSKIKKNELNALKPLFVCGSLCNNSVIGYDEKDNQIYLGDQTEVALEIVSNKFGFNKDSLEKQQKKVNEISFTSKRKMMSVIYKNEKKYVVYSKGAPNVLLEKCNKIYVNGKISKLDKITKKKILKQNEKFASNALRVLGFAFKETKSLTKDIEKDLVWLGLQAMIDLARPEAKQALIDCRTAGIRVIMLTGDDPFTAQAIANEIGLKTNGVILGKELEKLNESEIKQKLNSNINIFARVSPFHKLKLLEILKKDNKVAMTGDGVNDALALKKADIGIAMGIKGTEVAKEASDIILLDDNFASIVSAIKEGRRIFDNIRKFINYLFVCNFAEVGVLFLATLFLSLKEPILLPVQLLWINLLTDGLPALALGLDPATPDIMKKPPRKKGEQIINKRLSYLIGVIGFKKLVVLFATFFFVLPLGINIARSVLFTGFILYEFIRIASIRYQEKLNWFSNKWLLITLIVSVLLQLIILYTPLNTYFHILPLGFYEWSILLLGMLVGYLLVIPLTKIIIIFVKE